MSKKWLNATFLSFLIRCLRLWRGQHLMQGKPCYASAFCGFAAHPPGGLLLPLRGNSPCVVRAGLNIRGCGPLSTLGFFDRLWPPLIPGGLMSLFSVFRIYILYRLLMARFFLRQLALQLCPLCLQLAFRLFQRLVILRVIRGLLEQYV